MSRRFTRRSLAFSMAASAAAIPALAQAPAQASAESPEALLQAARDRLHRNHETLARFPLKQQTEPALRFEA